MSENFDPYYKWLGIAPSEQPPNHYRLLGLNLFEADLDVIESGSDRQMTHLRTFQTGPRMRECQQLLNEVATARVLLLDAQRKSVYDQMLQASVSMPVEAPPSATIAPRTPAKSAAPVVVAKGSRHRRKQAVSLNALVAGGIVGLVVLLAFGFGIRKAFQPATPPIQQSPPPESRVQESPVGAVVEAVVPPMETQHTDPPPSAPMTPAVTASHPSLPTNAFVDALEAYECTVDSQPQLTIDSSFDATKSWRLSLRVNASPHPQGTLLAWGDSRASLDPICIKAGPDYITGWVMDNTRSDSTTNFPKIPIDWSAWHEIELVHDAVTHILQLRVDDERQNVAVTHPPRPDRDMPVYLGGIGVGALHAFPCRLREVRLEQLTDPVNLPEPSTPAAGSSPQVAMVEQPTEMPAPTGTLGDLVKPTAANKLSIPAESELQVARDQIQRLFANDLGKKREPQESATLADKLVDEAIRSGVQPSVRYALLESAIEVASQAGAVAATSRAIHELDRAFLVDLIKLKSDAAEQLARIAKEPWEFKAVVELLEVVIAECLVEDRFDLATSLGDAALGAARRSKDSFAITRSVAQSREIKSLKVKYEPIQAALDLLTDAPDDAKANETIGRHLCLVKGRWTQGLPYLLKSNTSALREVAARDIQNPTNPDTQAEVGKGWMNAASNLERSTRLQTLLRAEHWYRLAAEQQTGIEKVPLETQVAALGKEIGELAEPPSGAVLVMTFEPSTLKRQGYVMDASQHGYVGIVKDAILVDGVAGKALAFDGQNSYVEIASTPWLAAPSAFSLSAWVNVVSWNNPLTARDYVLSNEAAGTRGYVLRYRAGGTVDLTVAAGVWRVTLSRKKASLEQWHHMGATFDGNVTRVFLDGEVVGEAPAPTTITPSDQPFRIGQAALSKERGIRGRIDEVAVFNRALSPDEVRTVYRIGLAGRPLMELK